ncbi:hypothetical protein, partial [Chryseobacterium sp. SIMBA_029]
KSKTAALPAQSQQLAAGAAQVAAGNAELNTKVQDVAAQLDAADKGLRVRLVQSNAQLVASGVLTQAQADKVMADFDAAAASTPV